MRVGANTATVPWTQVLAVLESGLDMRKIITHRLPAGEFRTGFEIMQGGQSGKVVLDWTS